jgi:CRISPR/Cas system-associated protein Cas10 (large subunit of type III CRISPR-Cas system)
MTVQADSPTYSDRKTCNACQLSRPITEFRRRKKNTEIRMNECRSCRSINDRSRRLRKKQKLETRQIQAAAVQVARTRNPSRCEAILEKLVDAMGGPETFVEKWSEECHRLDRHGRYSPRLIRMYEMLVNLMIHSGSRGRP